MNAELLVKTHGEGCVGWRILTCEYGNWKGGPAEILEVNPDLNAPEIVMTVSNDEGECIGVFDHEEVLVMFEFEPRQYNREPCTKCRYLGSFCKRDLYFCNEEHPTVIARFGDNSYYVSGLLWAIIGVEGQPENTLAIEECLKRALKIKVFRDKIVAEVSKWQDHPERIEKFHKLLAQVDVEEE